MRIRQLLVSPIRDAQATACPDLLQGVTNSIQSYSNIFRNVIEERSPMSPLEKEQRQCKRVGNASLRTHSNLKTCIQTGK